MKTVRPSHRPPIHKRRLLVNKRLQLTVLVHSLVLVLLVPGTIALIRVSETSPWAFNEIFPGFTIQRLMVLGIIFLVFLVAFLTSLDLTNRMAGPIYRLQKHMDDVLRGKTLEEFKFREGDHFVEVMQSYNKLLERLREKESAKKNG